MTPDTRSRPDGAGSEQRPRSLDDLLIGDSAPMRQLKLTIRRVAPTNASVFLNGPSGSGKEVAAQAIHACGRTSESPFIAVNCGAIPRELAESELFGHAKGAFTGAVERHEGYFQRAGSGTLFLDEISETAPELQVKLLRVLESGHFQPLGGREEVQASCRVITASNRCPLAAVKDGRLREDLYYRIAQFPIQVPALVERGRDVHLLSEFFLQAYCQQNGVRRSLSAQALQRLAHHRWPGNVRELKNVVTRACIMADDVISAAHVEACIAMSPPRELDVSSLVGQRMAEVEKHLVLATLERTGGDRQAAAKLLGISVRTVYNRIRCYGTDRPVAA